MEYGIFISELRCMSNCNSCLASNKIGSVTIIATINVLRQTSQNTIVGYRDRERDSQGKTMCYKGDVGTQIGSAEQDTEVTASCFIKLGGV